MINEVYCYPAEILHGHRDIDRNEVIDIPKFKIYSEKAFIEELHNSMVLADKRVFQFTETPSKTVENDVEELQAVYGFDLSILMEISMRMYEFLADIATSEPVAVTSLIYTVFNVINKFRSTKKGKYENIIYVIHESKRVHIINIGSDFDEEKEKEQFESFLIDLQKDEQR